MLLFFEEKSQVNPSPSAWGPSSWTRNSCYWPRLFLTSQRADRALGAGPVTGFPQRTNLFGLK